MTLKQISEVLNATITPAIMGDTYTVNPDLSLTRLIINEEETT